MVDALIAIGASGAISFVLIREGGSPIAIGLLVLFTGIWVWDAWAWLAASAEERQRYLHERQQLRELARQRGAPQEPLPTLTALAKRVLGKRP